ncbi:MAG: beta-glucosidase [Bradyrhizobium sp.]|nr:beta-glucosidase [Bradyrhizobium sp.]
MPSRLALPASFKWGTSTAAYQIEGAVAEDGRAPSIWDLFSRQGRIANGDIGDVACDHYHRYREDVALMKRLGAQVYRFSVSWPRVLPQGRGQANSLGLDFYDRLIDELLRNGIEPWLCLYHWDLPQALDDMGGWQNRDIALWFADYAALMARRYGDRVRHFATFNEPNVATLFGYGMNWNAPGIADRKSFLQAAHHVNLAHGEGIRTLRALAPGALLGAIHNRQVCLPISAAPEDAVAANILDACWNRLYSDPQIHAEYPPELFEGVQEFIRPGDMARIAQPMDWFGLNHYCPIYARADRGPLGFAWADAPHDVPLTGVGWRIDPDAFRNEIIATHQRYKLPIYITENGYGAHETLDETGGVNDSGRIAYFADYLKALEQAVASGADVRGYYLWSLLDNLEWGSGYSNRFGIVYVDYKTLKRVPKASFDWLAKLIRAQRDDKT